MVKPPAVTPAEPARNKNLTRAPASKSNGNPFYAIESNFLSAAGNMAVQRAAAGPSAHHAAGASILGGANWDSGQCSCGGTCDECKKKLLVQRKREGDSATLPSGFDAALQRSGGGSPLHSATRSTMETHFDDRFEDVRIHNDA